MIAPSFSAPHSPYWLGLTDVSHSSRQCTQLPCCFFVADPAVGCPAQLPELDGQERDVGVQPPPSGQIFPLASPVRGSPHDRWIRLDKGRCDDTAREHEPPWAKLFAQGAMTTVGYDEWD